MCRLFSGGYSLIVECSLLIVVVASLIVEHGLRTFRLQEVRHTGSAVVAPGIFLDQGSHLCLLHWQADSVPLSHQRSPHLSYILQALRIL